MEWIRKTICNIFGHKWYVVYINEETDYHSCERCKWQEYKTNTYTCTVEFRTEKELIEFKSEMKYKYKMVNN